MERGAGVLLPVSSLPSPYGIGTLGAEAYSFIDFLVQAGQHYWQILPIGPTSYGDSPYQSFSAFAGNPYLIDLQLLLNEKLLTPEELDTDDWRKTPSMVDYARLYAERFDLLRRAYARTDWKHNAEYSAFCLENRDWIEDYSLFMALKEQYGGKSWLKWPESLKLREPNALEGARRELADEIGFWRYCQYWFFSQWGHLKAYAARQGVSIIGDIPIYVALDSADVWAESKQFQLDEMCNPIRVAGVPPDLFSQTGQLWGNPLYRWERMEENGFAWWKRRMAFSAQLYDVIRIDHFVGIIHYYSIPAKDATAEGGEWVKGPGDKLTAAIGQAIGNGRIIAEDLGIVTPEVVRLRERCGYPGMKLMEFGFESDGQNQNLPCHFEKNCVAYGGTHDNETLAGFFAHQDRRSLRFARDYLNVRTNDELPWGVIRAGYASAADTVIFQMQDYLGLGNEARMNTPSTLGGKNWRWRLQKGELTPVLAERMNRLCQLYGR